MANLYSINKKKKITIEPLYLDNERWITSKVKLYDNFEIVASGVEPYFDATEIQDFISGAEKLLSTEINQVKTQFLEPNINISIELLDANKYLVNFNFQLYWEEEENDKSIKEIQFDTNGEEIKTFLSELKLEIKSIQKKEK